mmetsp:Transcript_24554/g.57167  ORF Transcript_24554/g.57167 Transcript_24554/m.57167 type:complete len:322 (-) Transcript_24554:582-1547(-)
MWSPLAVHDSCTPQQLGQFPSMVPPLFQDFQFPIPNDGVPPNCNNIVGSPPNWEMGRWVVSQPRTMKVRLPLIGKTPNLLGGPDLCRMMQQQVDEERQLLLLDKTNEVLPLVQQPLVQISNQQVAEQRLSIEKEQQVVVVFEPIVLNVTGLFQRLLRSLLQNITVVLNVFGPDVVEDNEVARAALLEAKAALEPCSVTTRISNFTTAGAANFRTRMRLNRVNVLPAASVNIAAGSSLPKVDKLSCVPANGQFPMVVFDLLKDPPSPLEINPERIKRHSRGEVLPGQPYGHNGDVRSKIGDPIRTQTGEAAVKFLHEHSIGR